MNLFAETDSQTLKTYGYQRRQVRGWNGLGRGIGICTLWYMEWLANGDLVYCTGNSTQYSVIIYMWKQSEKKNVYVYIYIYIYIYKITLLYSGNYHNTVNQLYFNNFFKKVGNKPIALDMHSSSKNKSLPSQGILPLERGLDITVSNVLKITLRAAW